MLYHKEAPFLASIMKASHSLAPVLSIKLAKVDHWDLHHLLQALSFSTFCSDALFRIEAVAELSGGIYRLLDQTEKCENSYFSAIF